MTSGPAYPAARAVAATIHEHFARLENNKAPIPEAKAVEAMIEASFWASLRREEGFIPKISLAYLPPIKGDRALLLEEPLPLAPEPLARLGPAVEQPGIHLGVWGTAEDLRVWGTTRTLPGSCFTVEVIAPGLLVVKESRDEDRGKYRNIAVLEGERLKVLDQAIARTPDCPGVLASLLGLNPTRPAGDVDVLIQLAIAMRAHGRGGALLVVPAEHSAWRESVIQPIGYAVTPPFRELTGVVEQPSERRRDRRWKEDLHGSVETIARLTAVDGAAIMTERYEVLAFGAKIGRRDGRSRVEQVLTTEPVQGARGEIVHPSQLGGTRHLSAAQFAMDQHDALALVASQDGRFTLFAWSSSVEMVQGHRVEALLL